ncbi:unnamed protein product [Phyllotreta striolata]|uniref:enoyl-CoA hydratase n=1 Tax=Phyllotreta striolata TaxID=444603 RepID=A0A9N9XQQ8_PHYSR|nr:unnamed protein product [Phyllotreta striolata]
MASKFLNPSLYVKNPNGLKTIYQATLRLCSQQHFETVKTSKAGAQNNVGLIQLNRPEVLNALNETVFKELHLAIKSFHNDNTIGAIVITGNDKAFAAGADIKGLGPLTFPKLLLTESEGNKANFETNKPIIAAVNGYAFGGGAELAMMCDIIYAGEKAKFGLPEILLGIIPGGGGTQRLSKTVGKYKAMEMILTGSPVTAQDAEKMGLVCKIFPVDKVLEESIKLAEKISGNSRIANAVAKESVNAALETSLQEGVKFEKRLFQACFGTKDQKEGMAAFIEKRKPNFTNE